MDNRLDVNGGLMKKFIYACFISALLASCTTAPNLPGYQKAEIPGDRIMLATWTKNVKPAQKLRIYIEGNAVTGGLFDKYAKVEHPVAMQLALKDDYPYIIYLGRPCYYVEQKACRPIAWEEGKYMPEIVDEMKAAIERIQKKYRITDIELIGYDGGGTLAMLLAARLKNAKVNVITIGGILNTEHYALFHDEQYPKDSLNPANERFLLSAIPQVHYVGGKDNVMPLAFTQDFVKKMPKPLSVKIKALPNADHYNFGKYNLDY